MAAAGAGRAALSLFPVQVPSKAAHSPGALSQSLEVQLQRTAAVKRSQRVQPIPQATHQVMELELAHLFLLENQIGRGEEPYQDLRLRILNFELAKWSQLLDALQATAGAVEPKAGFG